MKSSRPTSIHGKSLNTMSTESLQELLQLEMESSCTPNVELIKSILAVLDERTKPECVDIDAAWTRFLQDYLPSEPMVSLSDPPKSSRKYKRKRQFFRLGLIAALIVTFCLGIGMTASATGINILDAIIHYSSETFKICELNHFEVAPPLSNPEYTEIKAALIEAGITEQLIPNYLPDGYTQSEFYHNATSFVATYTSSNNSLILRIHATQGNNSTQHEKDSLPPQNYLIDGIDYFVSSNMGKYTIVWNCNGYECSIFGIPEKEDVTKIIESICLEE